MKGMMNAKPEPGIVFLMWGSTIPTIYYGFYCDPQHQHRYWTVVSVLAMGCTITTFSAEFCHPTLRPWRAAMYSGLGLSAIVFVIHGLLIHGWETQKKSDELDMDGSYGGAEFDRRHCIC